jgi:hypothetical protein
MYDTGVYLSSFDSPMAVSYLSNSGSESANPEKGSDLAGKCFCTYDLQPVFTSQVACSIGGQ